MSPPGVQVIELSKLFAVLLSFLIHQTFSNKTHLHKRSLEYRQGYVSEVIPSYFSIGFEPYKNPHKKFDTRRYFVIGRIGTLLTPIYAPRYKFTDPGCRGESSGRYYKDRLNCGVYYICIPQVFPNSHIHFTRKNFYCPEGQDFNEVTSRCVYSPFCYREYPSYPVTPGNIICAQNGIRPVYPEDCQNFYICHWMGYYYAIAKYTCNPIQNYCVKTLYFEDETNLCRGYHNFGGYITPGQNKAPCVNGDRRDRHPFPGDRTKYYQCVWVDNRLQVIAKVCHVGWYYDMVFRQCIMDENLGSGNTKPPPASTPTPSVATSKPSMTSTSIQPSTTPSTTTPIPTTWNPYPIVTTEEPIIKPTEWPTVISTESSESTTTEESIPYSTTTDPPTTTVAYDPDADAFCEQGQEQEKEGKSEVNPKDCTKYRQCLKYGNWVIQEFSCKKGKFYSVDHKRCVRAKACPQ